MSRLAVAGCMALAALGVVAVLDVGSLTAMAAPSVSPFTGSWSGTWSVAEIGVDGTFDWTISDAGRITGTVHHNQSGQDGTMVGHVGADGKLMTIGFAPADAPADWSNGFAFQGTAGIDDDDRLVLSVNRADSTGHSLVAILDRN